MAAFLRLSFVFGFICTGSALAQSKAPPPPEFAGWLPITDEERSVKAPVVEKDAGAEILLWRVRVADEFQGSDLQRIVYNYVRVKIFDEKGKEKASAVDLPYREPGTIMDVSGRTIKPDGSIVELDGKAVLRRVLAHVGRLSEKAVSFTMPAVEPGAIIEYRWKQTEDDNRFRYFALHFQRDLPVQNVTYYLKPLAHVFINEQMAIQAFHCSPTKPVAGRDGWQETSLHNIPAFHEEPYAPSNPNLEQWALLYYRPTDAKPPEKYWNEEGKRVYKRVKDGLKLSDEMKSGAAGAVASAKTDEEKIAALSAFLRQNVRSIGDPTVTAAERQQYFQKLPKDRERTAGEIFKSGLAAPNEMNLVFAGLAEPAGFDARPALIGSRLEVQFEPKMMGDTYFLDRNGVALKLGRDWKVLDVSRKRVSPGMLPWDEEGVFALICDPKEPSFIQTPVAPADASIDEHTGRFKLSAEGTLSGDVSERYTGHRAEEYRGELTDLSAAQREDWFRERRGPMFPDGEFTDFKIENLDDASKPLRLTYHLNAPLFAQSTGKRMLFQPNLFRRAQAVPFTASERRSTIEFRYGWKEVDRIRIELPPGYDFDSPDNPGGLKFGKLGSYNLDMATTKGATRELSTTREFIFGADGNLYIGAEGYPTLKKIFDEVRIRDTHSISIKAN
jgi:hypothetical protein